MKTKQGAAQVHQQAGNPEGQSNRLMPEITVLMFASAMPFVSADANKRLRRIQIAISNTIMLALLVLTATIPSRMIAMNVHHCRRRLGIVLFGRWYTIDLPYTYVLFGIEAPCPMHAPAIE